MVTTKKMTRSQSSRDKRGAKGNSFLTALQDIEQAQQHLHSLQISDADDVMRRLGELAASESRAEQVTGIDSMLIKELKVLLEKLEYLRKKDTTPSPDQQWDVIDELVKLILKLIFKAFVLQGMQPPFAPGGGLLSK